MSDRRNQQPRKRGPMGGMGHGMQPGEKPKNLKKSIKQLAQYIGKYKIAIFVVMLCAACSTVFNPTTMLRVQKSSEKQQRHCPRD